MSSDRENSPNRPTGGQYAPGDLYKDSQGHPCVCVGERVVDNSIWGISLIDGSHPRSVTLDRPIRKLSVADAWRLKCRIQRHITDRPRDICAFDSEFSPGDFYEDCAYSPCLCVDASSEEDFLWGVSLIDGSYPRSCSLLSCGPRKLSIAEAWAMKQAIEQTK